MEAMKGGRDEGAIDMQRAFKGAEVIRLISDGCGHPIQVPQQHVRCSDG